MTDFRRTLEEYVGMEIRLHWYFGYQEGVSPSEAVHYTSEGRIARMDGQTLVFDNLDREENDGFRYTILNLADVMIPVIDVKELVE